MSTRSAFEAAGRTPTRGGTGDARDRAGHADSPGGSVPEPDTPHPISQALRALEAIGEAPGGVSAQQLATDLELPMATIRYIITTLLDDGQIVHLADRDVYVPGRRARDLGETLSRQLAVHPDVENAISIVHHQADAAAYYAVYRDTEIVIAHIEDSDRRPRIRPLDVGFHEAVHSTAFGKIMLASMTFDQRSAYFEHAGLQAVTPSTICDREILEEQLTHISGSQVALESGEFQNGLACLGSPVHAANGVVVASVAISLPLDELRARRWNVERAVRQGAVRISRSLERLGVGSQ
ncbi:helix-turn-helix domain-containing protein [Allosaccharopolyspora coralli]|uniref:Helix-turn-helix domain-containing protein n=1 Tax=Allosaccharopolyspora coralli TaxID=2665642 RepID=A0A5Q3Q2P4_9PSEU|nr:IclR family transcriptional regulator C-terminal domain-containing protein [Allosaccharopolyspora coralli]QGK68623.1 helix-turn-helix domain-containing protein [Allosaccharopolyspora coralli]